jgi:hypothetical protein
MTNATAAVYALATTAEVLTYAADCGTVAAGPENCYTTLSGEVAAVIETASAGLNVYIMRTIFYTEVWQRLPQSDAWALLTTEEENGASGEDFSFWTD